jgi:hypothetical protein
MAIKEETGKKEWGGGRRDIMGGGYGVIGP